jgi:hypothetical protein
MKTGIGPFRKYLRLNLPPPLGSGPPQAQQVISLLTVSGRTIAETTSFTCLTCNALYEAPGEALWRDLAPREHPAASNAVQSSLAFVMRLTTTTLSVGVTERNGLIA